MKKIILLSIVILLSLNLVAEEINQKDVLMNQANRLTSTRKYMLANELYEKILVDYPGDVKAITRLITNLLLLSKFDKAEELINTQRNYLNDYDETKLEIRVLLAKSEVKKAYQVADRFLQKNNSNIKSFGEIAQLFESYRAFDKALIIYQAGREASGDEFMFTRNIAFALDSAGRYEEAMNEYLKHADKFKSYQHYVLSRAKKMLDLNPHLIKVIQDYRKNNENQVIIEIYAEALAYIGDTEKSLEQFLLVDEEKLLRFGKQQTKLGQHDIALFAYNAYITNSKNIPKIADAKYQVAEILIEKSEFKRAKSILLDIYNDDELKSKRLRYKTRSNMSSRVLLARISLIIDNDPVAALQYLREAEDFTYNAKERKEIVLRQIELNILLAQYDQAEVNLKTSLQDIDYESEIYKKGVYYRYLLSLFQQKEDADSLLGELLIHFPGNAQVNDVLMLTVQLSKLTETATGNGVAASADSTLLKIYRNFTLFRSTEQIIALADLADSIDSELLKVLAFEWAYDTSNNNIINGISEDEFTDKDLAEYVRLRKVEMQNDDSLRVNSAEKFLSENPQSLFSPQFRRLMTK